MKKFYQSSQLHILNHSKDQNEVYYKRCSEFDKNQIGFNKTVMLGDSITEGGQDWNKYFNTENIVNRGISGDTTLGILARLNEIYFYKPINVFLLIGINDIFNTDSPNRKNITPKSVANNILKIADSVHKHSPSTNFYIQTTLPINDKIFYKLAGYFPKHKVHLKNQINQINLLLKKAINEKIYTLIDLHDTFLDNNKLLSKNFTYDGVHLNKTGYNHWSQIIHNYI